MAMLAALSSVTDRQRLFCLHVEHGLRAPEESKGDAVFVRDFCEEQGIGCTIVSILPGEIESFARHKGIGIEAAARHFRRKALFEAAAKLGEETLILTAHTKDDMLETVLMRFLRGVGPAGLAAMPVRRGQLLRPLLSMSRAEVVQYLNDKNITWREDSTNKEEIFLRNKIRQKLIPLLDGSFPSWKSGVTGIAETQSLAADFLADEAKARITWEITAGGVFTEAENFFSQPLIIREEAVFQGVNLLKKTQNTSREDASNLRFASQSSDKEKISTIKRSVVRKFCSGFVNAADLGTIRVSRKKGKILLSFTAMLIK